MNRVKKTVLITIGLLLIQGVSTSEAQNERLMQDIRVGETILTELINDNRAQFPFHGGTTRMVQGEYIDGYGVHFSIGSGITGRSIVLRHRQGEQQDEVSPDAAREKIEQIMRDYLQNYAVMSRHLSDNEHVRLTYGQQARVQRVIAVRGPGNEERLSVPRISVSVTVADLKRHKNGQISDEVLQQRIRVTDLSDQEIGNDLKVFSSVLKTSLDNTETTHLRSGRDPSLNYIPGLGAHYSVEVSARGTFQLAGLQRFTRDIDEKMLSDFSNIEIDLGEVTFDDGSNMVHVGAPSIEFKGDSISIAFTELDDSLMYNVDELQKRVNEMRDRFEELRKRGVEIAGRIEYQRTERDTIDYANDLEMIKNQVEETIRDYGPTLRSLSDDEFLIVTINWRGRDLPDKTTFRIRKSDLVDGKAPDVKER